MTVAARRDPPDGVPLLDVKGLVKEFGGVRAVDGIDLLIGAGDMRCIIGPNGCGKTTLFNLITGYLPATEGSILFEGRDLAGMAMHEIARAGIVRKFQVPSVFPDLTVADNVASALIRRRGRGGRSSAEGRHLLQMVRLDTHAGTRAGTLSHGQKQWLELAMVLATDPLLVLLDEPAAGMTRSEKMETVRLLEEIRSRSPVALLVIEHDMAFVEALDCGVSVMMMGRMVTSGTFAEIRLNDEVRAAYLGPVRG
jgi:ABC-type branched-subunit amino acid transport system ATPase component